MLSARRPEQADLSAPPPVYVIGDIHGHPEVLARLLNRRGLVDDEARWTGGDAIVWLVGDFVDRGPDGIGALDLVMRLGAESQGRVRSLLGNHDAMLVAARRLGERECSGPLRTFLNAWLRNGGRMSDLERLTPAHESWIADLPAMAVEGTDLLVHADALLYIRYGRTIPDVNARISQIVGGDDTGEWDELLVAFAERRAFGRPEWAARFLRAFDGTRIVHGHTPIPYVTKQDASEVTGPLIYSGGLCVNVDGGIYAGGPGFIWQASGEVE